MQFLQNIKQLKQRKKSDYTSEITKEAFSLFEEYTSEEKSVAIAVSSGVDSMTLATLFILRAYQKKYPLKNIHIIHCNHNIRQQSTQEAKFIQTFFEGCTIHIPPKRNKNFPKDEKSLRQRRYQYFQKILKKNSIQILFLGHHLEDRIESSFLNCIRGAGLKGFLNMQMAQENHPLLKIASCRVYRPLLNNTKKQIIAFCKQFGIRYFEDETNADLTTSQRNFLRHEITEKLIKMNNGKSKFLESMKQVYEELDRYIGTGIKPVNETKYMQKIPTFPTRNAEYAYHYSSRGILELRNYLGIATNLRSSQIQERTKRLTETKSGRKEFHGVYFFIHEQQLYVIKANQNFWKLYLSNQQLIKKLGTQIIAGITIEASEKRFLGATLRFPKPGDKFAGKTRNRRCINQKIPVFRRNFIPLAEKDGKIIHMRKNIRKN